MNRLKRLIVCTVAAACSAMVLLVATGCAQQQQSYTPPEATPAVSQPTVSEEGVLRVGVNTANAPLAGQSQSSSKIVGIDVDVAAALADALGLKVQVVDVGDGAEAALKAGTVDVVMGVSTSSSTGSFWTSDTYLPTAIALFAASSSAQAPSDDAAVTIAAQVSSTSAWAVTNEFENVTISTTEDLRSAFDALESGQADYVASDAVAGSYIARNAGDAVSIVALMQQPAGYAVGVLDGNTQLKQAVSQALSTLVSDGTVAVIERKWLGTALDLASVPLTSGALTSGSGSTGSTGSDDAVEAEASEEEASGSEASGTALVTA